MVQPKTPPISIRIPPAILATLDEFAASKNLTRHGAILKLLVAGLGGWTGLETAQWSAAHLAAMEMPEPLTIKRIPPGPTSWPSGAVILPEHTEDPGSSAALRVAVPLLERKAFNPQPKKGAKK